MQSTGLEKWTMLPTKQLKAKWKAFETLSTLLFNKPKMKTISALIQYQQNYTKRTFNWLYLGLKEREKIHFVFEINIGAQHSFMVGGR